MSKQPLPAPTASAIGPCPTIIHVVGRSGTGTGSLPRTIAPPTIVIAIICSTVSLTVVGMQTLFIQFENSDLISNCYELSIIQSV